MSYIFVVLLRGYSHLLPWLIFAHTVFILCYLYFYNDKIKFYSLQLKSLFALQNTESYNFPGFCNLESEHFPGLERIKVNTGTWLLILSCKGPECPPAHCKPQPDMPENKGVVSQD